MSASSSAASTVGESSQTALSPPSQRSQAAAYPVPAAASPPATAPSSFECALDSTAPLSKILRSVELEKNQMVAVSVTDRGVKFTMHQNRVMQAKAYVKTEIFSVFRLPGPSIMFACNLTTLLSCLEVFGEAASLKLTYSGADALVNLLLECNGVVTECSIRTVDTPELLDINFRMSPMTARFIIESAHLREAFAELESSDAATVAICMSPTVPHLCLAAEGDASSARIDFVGDPAGVFSEVTCAGGAVEHKYNLAVVRPCLRVLAKANCTNLRMNEAGVLSMQHVIPTDDGFQQWVEFLLCAIDDDD